jgi:hypothetical protein
MGGGDSKYVQNQERFVRENYDAFKSKLPDYSSGQIKGKMRQMYAGSDERPENHRSYINNYTWTKAKSSIKIKR